MANESFLPSLGLDQPVSQILAERKAKEERSKPAIAKAVQSATLGFGADIAEKLRQGRGPEIRKLANQFQEDHPLASLAADLTIGAAQTALVPGSVAARIGTGLAARTAVGTGVGAVVGAGRGGDRAANATAGAIEGGATALGLGLAGKLLLSPAFARFGAAGFSQAKAAAGDIKQALAKGGKNVQQLNDFLTKNPGARIVDFFGGEAKNTLLDLTSKAVPKSSETMRRSAQLAQQDIAGQGKRIEGATGKLTSIKNDMMENLDKVTKARNEAYSKANQVIAPLTDDLKKLLKLPSVAPLWEEAQREVDEAFRAGRTTFGKYKYGKEAPIQALDSLQRKLTALGEDFLGTTHKGTLDKVAKVVSEHAGTELNEAQHLAAQAGSMERGQTWGHDFSKGLKTGSMADFDALSPLGKEHAKLGVITGLEEYLTNNQRLGEAGLRKISDFLKTDDAVKVIGKREAAQAAKVFKNEADRARVNADLMRGNTRYTEFLKEKEEMVGAAAVNAVAPGKAGTILRFLGSQGFSEERAKNIINIAMSPNGMKKLQDAGLKKNVLDRVTEAVGVKGALPAKAAVGMHKQVEESE